MENKKKIKEAEKLAEAIHYTVSWTNVLIAKGMDKQIFKGHPALFDEYQEIYNKLCEALFTTEIGRRECRRFREGAQKKRVPKFIINLLPDERKTPFKKN